MVRAEPIFTPTLWLPSEPERDIPGIARQLRNVVVASARMLDRPVEQWPRDEGGHLIRQFGDELDLDGLLRELG